MQNVVHVTHAGGRGDTPGARKDIWGGRETPLRPLLLMLLVASLLHVPLLPTHLSAWIRLLFRQAPAAVQGPQQDLVLPIEVDLLSDDESPAAAPADQAFEPGAPVDDDELSDDDDELSDDDLMADFDDDDDDEDVPDAGAPPAVADAGAESPSDAGAEEADAAAPEDGDAGAARPVAELPKGQLKDPFEVAGAGNQIRATHPNVNVYIAADVLRGRKMHTRFADLLTAIPQWDQLLGGTGIDPLRDFDRILISGPQFRNPQWIVVVLQYRISTARMRAALAAVVKRDGGEASMIDRDTAALGNKGDRLAFLVPKQKVLWIMPESQKQDVERARRATPFAKTPPAGIVVDLRTPANAFAGSGFAFPDSINHIRLHFNLESAGGYRVKGEGWDASPDEARKHAEELEAAIAALNLVDKAPDFLKSFASKLELSVLGDTEFKTQGDKIYATAKVSEKQLGRIVRFIKKGLDDRVRKKNERAEKRKKAKGQLRNARQLLDKVREARRKKRATRPGKLSSSGDNPPRTPPKPSSSAPAP